MELTWQGILWVGQALSIVWQRVMTVGASHTIAYGVVSAALGECGAVQHDSRCVVLPLLAVWVALWQHLTASNCDKTAVCLVETWPLACNNEDCGSDTGGLQRCLHGSASTVAACIASQCVANALHGAGE
jgi:hypothetical protein